VKKSLMILCAVMIALALGAAVATAMPKLAGKVLETMDSGGYTYTQIATTDGNVWVAIPKTKIKKGQNVSFQPGQPMPNFTSKTLGRTFDVIYFSGGLAE